MKSIAMLFTACFVLMTAASSSASAATIRVSTTVDSIPSAVNHGKCSLRQAITAAQTDSAFGGCIAGQGADTVLLPAGQYQLSATPPGDDQNLTGDLDVFGSDPLTVQPVGKQARVAIRGGGTDRILSLNTNGTLVLRDVTITGGEIDEGNFYDSENNGGGISSGGNLTLDGVSVIGNSTLASGGGLALGGRVDIVNSTIGLNLAQREGGGLLVLGGETTLRSSTIARNSAGREGGGFEVPPSNPHFGPFTKLNLTNVINASNHGYGPDCASSDQGVRARYVVTTQELNDVRCYTPDEKYNQVVESPRLGPLSKAHRTWVFPLLPDSPAIWAAGFKGNYRCPAVDQLGEKRPPLRCDIGAVQFTGAHPFRGLKLHAVKKKVRMKHRRSARIGLLVKNLGTRTATKVKLCIRGRHRRRVLSVRGRTCRRLGAVKAGAHRRVNFRIVRKRHGHRRAVRLRFKLSARGFPPRTVRVKVRLINRLCPDRAHRRRRGVMRISDTSGR